MFSSYSHTEKLQAHDRLGSVESSATLTYLPSQPSPLSARRSRRHCVGSRFSPFGVCLCGRWLVRNHVRPPTQLQPGICSVQMPRDSTLPGVGTRSLVKVLALGCSMTYEFGRRVRSERDVVEAMLVVDFCYAVVGDAIYVTCGWGRGGYRNPSSFCITFGHRV